MREIPIGCYVLSWKLGKLRYYILLKHTGPGWQKKLVWQKNNFVEKKLMRATSERLSQLIYSYIINNNNEIILFYALI